jgi:hypothetical protein
VTLSDSLQAPFWAVNDPETSQDLSSGEAEVAAKFFFG